MTNAHERLWGFLSNPAKGVKVIALVISALCYGASGFLYFEIDAKPELNWSDGFWWSMVTMTTIGYGDYYPTTLGGRYLVGVPIMVLGVGLLGYGLSVAASSLVEAQSRKHRGLSTMTMKKHLLIINCPSVVKVLRLLEELQHPQAMGADLQVVLVDEDLQEIPTELAQRGVGFVRGNPIRDDTLTRAAIDDAAHAVILVRKPGDPESDNQVVAVVLAIEARHRGVRSVVECVDPASEELLKKAGADRIICSARLEAGFLASEALQPGTQDIVKELITATEGQQLFVSALPQNCPGTYGAAHGWCRKYGHTLLGVRRGEGNSLNPSDDFAIKEGDLLITVGAVKLPKA